MLIQYIYSHCYCKKMKKKDLKLLLTMSRSGVIIILALVNLLICNKIYKKSGEKSDYISDLIYSPYYASGLMPENKYFNLKSSCDALNQEIEEISNFGEKYQNYFSPNYNLKNAKPIKFHLNYGTESMQLQREILKIQLEIQNSLRIPCIYQYAKYDGIPFYNKIYCRAKKAIFISVVFTFATIFLTYVTIKEIFCDFENFPIDIKICILFITFGAFALFCVSAYNCIQKMLNFPLESIETLKNLDFDKILLNC